MAKKKIHFLRLVITGSIWTLVYLELSSRLCWSAFEFDALRLNDWGMRIGDFLNNRWIVNTGKDWGLFLFMLCFLPIYFIGWRIVYRIPWERFLSKQKRTPKEIRPTTNAMAQKAFEPSPLRVQSSALLSVPPTPPQQTPSQPQAEGMPPIPDTSSPPPQIKYEDAEQVQQMLSMTAGIKADFFPHVVMEEGYASFAMSTEKQAVVVRIINRPESTFAVDTEIDIKESDWFYETGLISTPAKDIIAIAQSLQNNEPNSVATPVILLMGGSLLNIEETLAYFEKNGVVLLRTDTVEGDEIPLVMDFLTEYFGLRT